MPQRALTQCKRAGCRTLVHGGWCPEHTIDFEAVKRARFDAIDARKTPESKKFYNSTSWKKATKLHREKEPLCRRCKAEGKVKIGNLSHHNPELSVLLAHGFNPFDDQYLETLCAAHHQRELSRRINHGPH